MTAEHVIPHDLHALADLLAERQAGAMRNQLVELRALLAPALPVRTVPGANWVADSFPLAANKLADIGGDLERRSLTVRCFFTAAEIVWIGPNRDAVIAAAAGGSGAGCFQLTSANPTLGPIYTAGPVYLATSSATVTASWWAEEYQPFGLPTTKV